MKSVLMVGLLMPVALFGCEQNDRPLKTDEYQQILSRLLQFHSQESQINASACAFKLLHIGVHPDICIPDTKTTYMHIVTAHFKGAEFVYVAVKKLIKLGADVNLKDNAGYTPLQHWLHRIVTKKAILTADHVKVVVLLLQHGAEVTQGDYNVDIMTQYKIDDQQNDDQKRFFKEIVKLLQLQAFAQRAQQVQEEKKENHSNNENQQPHQHLVYRSVKRKLNFD